MAKRLKQREPYWKMMGQNLRARAPRLAKRLLAYARLSRFVKNNPARMLRYTEHRRWVAHAFRDFTTTGGNQDVMFTTLAMNLGILLKHFEEWESGGGGDEGKGRGLAEALLNVCAQIDDGTVWHKELKLRSYVDISVQLKVLRIFIDYLAGASGTGAAMYARTLTTLLLEHSPESRPALLAHAEVLLEAGEVDLAIDTIQHALRIQAVCTSAQQLLFQAYQAKREMGSTDEALRILDYDLTDKFCRMPFTYLSTGWQGAAHLCSCPAWVPFPVGNVLTADSAEMVWNSDAAQEIRRSILDGDYSYCSRTICSFITAQKLPRKDEIEDPILRGYIDNHVTRLPEFIDMLELNHDPSCNLACPSCRTEITVAKADDHDIYARATERVLLPLLKMSNRSYISGGGEAFASRHYRSILSRLNRQEYPQHYVQLMTNALLITPQKWNDYPGLPEMIGAVSVSIDAAKAETYEKLRWPGKWATLVENLEHIAEMRRAGKIRIFGLNFVVQNENYRELLDFVEWGIRLGVDIIWVQRVINYGSYDEATFADIDVTSPDHPNHAELLEILRNPLLSGPLIDRNMLMCLLPEVVASDERVEYLYRIPQGF